jgi:DNA-directed RNA polymerase subunit RPC12/RpoP
MKRCTSCNRDLPLVEFSPQKTRPGRLYAYCDECRSQPFVKPLSKGYRQEVKEMRAKAKELRAFDDTAAVALFKERETGVTIKALAEKHGRNESTIIKTLRRGRRLSM